MSEGSDNIYMISILYETYRKTNHIKLYINVVIKTRTNLRKLWEWNRSIIISDFNLLDINAFKFDCEDVA